MPRYALTINDLFTRLETKPTQPPDISHKLVKWLPCDPVAQPSFDPLTEKITGPTYTVGAGAVTEVWTKVSLSAQEISDRKDASVSSLNGSDYKPLLLILLQVVNDNRALRLKVNNLIDATSQAGTVTKFPTNQSGNGTTAIDIPLLKTAIKALLP